MDDIFVGRDEELQRLHGLLADSSAGRGRTCFVAGEAGAGKSSLLEQFANQAQARDERLTVVLGRSNAQTGLGEPYLPFMEILAAVSGAQISKGAEVTDAYAARLRKLATSSARILAEVAPDIIGTFVPGASLLTKIGESIIREARGAVPRREPAPGLAPGELDAQTIYRQFTDLLAGLSQRSPLIVVLDDMHWADAASINLFTHLAVKLATCPVLLIGTFRGNDLHAGRRGERHPLIPALNELKRVFGDIVIDLEAVRQESRRGFVDALVDAEPNLLDEAFRRQLLAHTGGHPLFTVELLRSFKENGTLRRDDDGRWRADRALDWEVLPARLEGVIEERIGRVEENLRELLVYGSVEGLSFTAQIVAKLHNVSEREILKCLSQELVKRHCLVREGSTEKIGKQWLSQFSFSHALFQQYLYNELSERERMILHADIAESLEELYRDKRDTVLLQLARHYASADEPERAVACLVRASSLAMRISACDEARLQLLRAMELLEQLPEGEGRQRLELDVQSGLCLVYRATRGWDAPELITASYRARALCNALHLPQRLAPILFGMWSIHLMRLDLRAALQMAEEYHQLAVQAGSDDMLLHAHIAVGNTLFWMGRLPAARSVLAEALRLLADGRDYIGEFGQDPGVVCLALTGLCAWLQGEAGEGADCCEQALARAEALAHPFSQAIALWGALTLDQHRHDLAALATHTAQLLKISSEHQFPLYQGLGMVFSGWLDAMHGATAAGTTRMDEGFRDWMCKHGGRTTHSMYCVMLAEALREGGQPERALAALDGGLRVARECEERCYEPELLRLQGELLAATGAARADIDSAYALALQLAREQGQFQLGRRIEASLASHRQ